MESRSRRRLPGGPLYGAFKAAFITILALSTRVRVVGLDRVPRTGGLLLVSNHLSFADPEILVGIFPRPLTLMAKEELFRPWYSRLLAGLTGAAFPVRRGQNDIRAVRDALDLISAGAAVAVFPEGTRRIGGLGVAHRGVAYLATRARCPVLPVGIVGTEAIRTVWSLARRPSFEVHFGEPFMIEAADGSDQIVGQIMSRIAELLPNDRRGAYAAPSEAMRVG
ncbi:MAG: phospholipid/glycerol acyltransferase [Chloroflexi bacterium]|nr:phospholipid/glycerol acyltransferase [Chloroflexota bacterium]